MSAAGSKQNESARLRAKGSGGIIDLGAGKWKIDIEISRDPITKRRRRVARHVLGTREDAEVAQARQLVAGHETRIQAGTRAPGRYNGKLRLISCAARPGLSEVDGPIGGG